jgi:DNA polymerase-3 subunit gamma/tau
VQPSEPTPAPEPDAGAEPPAEQAASLGLADVRRIWPDLLERVKAMRRFTWILLSQNAQVVGLDGSVLTVGFKNAGARDSFIGGGSEEILRQAAIDLVGADWKVEAIVDPSAEPGAEPRMQLTRPAVREVPRAEPVAEPDLPDGPPDWARDDAAAPQPPPARADPEAIARARGNIQPTRRGTTAEAAEPADDPDADAHRDDPDADDSGLDTTELLQRELGAQVIEEITHE